MLILPTVNSIAIANCASKNPQQIIAIPQYCLELYTKPGWWFQHVSTPQKALVIWDQQPKLGSKMKNIEYANMWNHQPATDLDYQKKQQESLIYPANDETHTTDHKWLCRVDSVPGFENVAANCSRFRIRQFVAPSQYEEHPWPEAWGLKKASKHWRLVTLGWGLHMLAQWLVDLILGENSPAVFTLPILTTTCMKLNMEPVASWLTIFPSGNDNFWVPYGYMMYSSAPDVHIYMYVYIYMCMYVHIWASACLISRKVSCLGISKIVHCYKQLEPHDRDDLWIAAWSARS